MSVFVEGLKKQIEKKFETFYKTNKTRRAFDELYQDVLALLVETEKTHVIIPRKQLEELIKNQPKRKAYTMNSYLDDEIDEWFEKLEKLLEESKEKLTS